MNVSAISFSNYRTSLKNNVNFKGENFVEFVDGEKLIHETAFFREPNTDEFVKNYLENEFLSKGEKVDILVGACSVGNEVYSQAMLYDEYKNRVNILGFDVSKKAIDRAKKGRFLMQDNGWVSKSCECKDAYLVDNNARTERQKRYTELFKKYFEYETDDIPKDIESRSVYRGRVIFEKMYKIKEGIAKNCSFHVGDIRNLDNLVQDDSVHCLFFRNALYHLVCAYSMRTNNTRNLQFDHDVITRAVVQHASKKLKKGGLFVFGEKEAAQGVDTRTVRKIMEEYGFEPLNKVKKPDYWYCDPNNYEANIWRKVG